MSCFTVQLASLSDPYVQRQVETRTTPPAHHCGSQVSATCEKKKVQFTEYSHMLVCWLIPEMPLSCGKSGGWGVPNQSQQDYSSFTPEVMQSCEGRVYIHNLGSENSVSHCLSRTDRNCKADLGLSSTCIMRRVCV